MMTRVSLILLGKMPVPKSGSVECVQFALLKQPNKPIKIRWGF